MIHNYAKSRNIFNLIKKISILQNNSNIIIQLLILKLETLDKSN